MPPVATRKPTVLEGFLSVIFRLLPLKHGAHRLLDRIKPQTWVKRPSMVLVPYCGHAVQMDVSDLVGWHFLIMRNFDPEIAEVLLRFTPRHVGNVFWDIGANKGALSYAMATALRQCNIVAIEPQRAMRALLEANLETLAHGRHEVFSVAIGEQPEVLELVIPPNNRGQASLTIQKEVGSIVEQIEVVTADTIRQQSRYGWPTLVKIDVEGFEPAVIRSLTRAFADRHIRACVFECHPSEPKGFGQIRAAVEPYGYRLFAVRKTPFSTRLVPTGELVRGATDYVFVRDDLAEK